MRLLSALNFAYNQARNMVLQYVGTKDTGELIVPGQIAYAQNDDRIASLFSDGSYYLLDERMIGDYNQYQLGDHADRLPTFTGVDLLIQSRLNQVRTGIGQKFVVRVATTQPLSDLVATGGFLLDGVGLVGEDLVLLFNQPDPVNNGIYTVSNLGLSNIYPTMPSEVSANHLVLVQSGDTYADAVFICTTNAAPGFTSLNPFSNENPLQYTRFGVSQPVARSYKNTISLIAGSPVVISHGWSLSDPEDYIIQLKEGSNPVYASVTTLDNNSLQIEADGNYSNVRVLITEVL